MYHTEFPHKNRSGNQRQHEIIKPKSRKHLKGIQTQLSNNKNKYIVITQ